MLELAARSILRGENIIAVGNSGTGKTHVTIDRENPAKDCFSPLTRLDFCGSEELIPHALPLPEAKRPTHPPSN
jgi:hypothetical protein